VKGGGQPSAALSVGSRAVGKRKTLYAMQEHLDAQVQPALFGGLL